LSSDFPPGWEQLSKAEWLALCKQYAVEAEQQNRPDIAEKWREVAVQIRAETLDSTPDE
jgi:hypothetical protein